MIDSKNAIYVESAKSLMLIVAAVGLGRITHGGFIAVLAAAGCCSALSNKVGFSISMFLLFPSLVVINRVIFPKEPITSLSLRFGVMFIGICLTLIASRRRGEFHIPLMGLLVYSLYMLLPSSIGYCPMVSYMKIVNFITFLAGIFYGLRNLQNHPNELFKLRAFLLAVVFFYVIGSAVLYPFPGISTLRGYSMTGGAEGISINDANYVLKEMGGMGLFCGILYHSQALSGILACCFAWTVCDMLFIEKRFRLPHGILIAITPVLIYMSRSRMGLFSIAVFLTLITIYTVHRSALSPKLKKHIRSIVISGVTLIVIAAGVAEIRSNAISRWLRKTDDLSSDTRALSESVTASRMGLIEKTLNEFKRNPLFGSGFQVESWHKEYIVGASKGLILSAPIEKGLLPLMVLGESGIIGSLIFWGFIINFCVICARKHYVATLTLFWVLFATNMGEATFFSPGGPGGVEWIFSVVGGYIIDMIIFNESRVQKQSYYFRPAF